MAAAPNGLPHPMVCRAQWLPRLPYSLVSWSVTRAMLMRRFDGSSSPLICSSSQRCLRGGGERGGGQGDEGK